MERTQRVLNRISELANLQDGWLYGDGKAISEASRTRAAWVLSWLLASSPTIPAPGVYPTPEGGLQAEWATPDACPMLVEVVFEGDSFTGIAVCVDTGEESQFLNGTVGELQSWVRRSLLGR
jgi:hypothetical protein